MKSSTNSLLYTTNSRYCYSVAIGDVIRHLSFIFVVLHLFPFPESSLFCLGIDSITPNQKVRDGETIVSAGGFFELGFFSPTASKNLRYVGIWFIKYPNEKVLWVANRENPVKDSSGVITIGIDGNLVIADGTNNTIWSSNVTFASNHTIAVLSDAGNLVLKENKSNGVVFWESFDHPTDSFLPGMKIGINTRTREQINLTSWKDGTDPSVGNFALVVDPQESPQGFIMNASDKHWRTGQWAGRGFIGIPNMIRDYRAGFDLNEDPQEGTVYFTYAKSGDTILPFFYVTYAGDFLRIDWDKEEKEWRNSTVSPRGPCDLYNTCGSFGNCDNDNSPICNCFKGYEPRFKEEWNRGNWSGGCFRRSKFRCERNTSSDKEENDGFFTLTRMKLPDFSHYVPADHISECKSNCLKNCSCVACAHVDGIGCMLWLKDLVDLQDFPSGDLVLSGGQQLHIRIAYSELGENSKRNMIIIIITTVVSVVVVMSFVAYILLCRRKGTKICNEKLITSTDYQRRDLFRKEIDRGGSSEVPSFSLQSIEAATNKFSATNKLGQGGFGPVYKGIMSDGREIAVKRLSRSSGQGNEEFKNEVLLISKLQHRSLVKLLGFCIQGEETLLVYEYMPNKSLDKLIFGSSSIEEVPNWDLRFKIIEGIARGILYLHRDSRLKIIHRDLKASNILLDEHMNPKISDFGMARIFGGDQSVANTNRVVGTYGYMSPEYAMQGIFSEKSDVFSFGVLLLEVISGKRNNVFYNYNDQIPQTLLAYVWQLWTEGKSFELLDPRLNNSNNSAQVNRCIHVALLCVQQNAKDRPTMSAIVNMLCNETSDLTSPDRPAFSLNERVDESSNPSSTQSFTCSRNECSITNVDGR